MVTRRRAIGGTGLAGGIFEGIMASEDIKNRRSQEDRMLALTESRIESDIVDRKAKALKMEIDQETFNAVKDKRAKEKEINDYIAQNAFIDDVVQITSPTGGFVNKPIKRMKDFTMEEWLPFHQNIIGLTLSKGLLKPEQIDGALKSVEEMQKKVGLTKFNRLIRNLDSDEAKQLILKEFGVENYTGAKYVVDEATPYIQFNDGQQQRRIDLSAYLQTLGIYDLVMQPLTSQLTLKEKVSEIDKNESITAENFAQASLTNELANATREGTDPKSRTDATQNRKITSKNLQDMKSDLEKWNQENVIDASQFTIGQQVVQLYNTEDFRKRYNIGADRRRNKKSTEYTRTLRSLALQRNRDVTAIVGQLINFNARPELGDKYLFSISAVAERVARYMDNVDDFRAIINDKIDTGQVQKVNGRDVAVFNDVLIPQNVIDQIEANSIKVKLDKKYLGK